MIKWLKNWLKMRDVKRRIGRGTYETPDKLAVALECAVREAAPEIRNVEKLAANMAQRGLIPVHLGLVPDGGEGGRFKGWFKPIIESTVENANMRNTEPSPMPTTERPLRLRLLPDTDEESRWRECHGLID